MLPEEKMGNDRPEPSHTTMSITLLSPSEESCCEEISPVVSTEQEFKVFFKKINYFSVSTYIIFWKETLNRPNL